MLRAARSVVLLFSLGLAALGAWVQSLVGNEIRVSPRTAGSHFSPDVAAGPDGRFVVVWQQAISQGSQGQSFVMARLFDAAGQPRGRAFRVARHGFAVFARRLGRSGS